MVIDTKALADRDNKLDGEIANVVRDERQWRKESYWPSEFVKRPTVGASGSEESTVGKLPPSDEDDEADMGNMEEGKQDLH